jgi:ribosomal protein S18 acetylase RimI-like enzyme
VIELQLLTPDDWSVWRSQRLSALAESPAAFGSRLADWRGEGDREDRWRARLSIAGSRNVVAKLGGELAGMASGVPFPVRPDGSSPRAGVEIELISMWVAPSVRGHGVADVLIQDLVTWAASLGAPAVRLSVRETNARAIAFYRRHRFVATSERATDEDHTGASVAELVFRKPL